MNKRTIASVTLALAIFSGAAVAGPRFGTWLSTQRIATSQDMKNQWGPVKGEGWSQLPVNIVRVTGRDGAQYPICLFTPNDGEAASAQPGMLGLAHNWVSGNAVKVVCRAYGAAWNVKRDATVFIGQGNRPAPVWTPSTSAKPEPWGAVVLATQESPARRLFACTFADGGEPVAGFIRDNGECFGATTDGGSKSSATYDVLVASNAPGDIAPRYGWVGAASNYMPHGNMAYLVEKNGVGRGGIAPIQAAPKTHTVCRVKDGNEWWPGYVQADFNCGYFTYFNGSTQKKSSSTYEVYRRGNGPMLVDYAFNKMGGKSYYACTAFKTGSGPIMGFSNNLTGCTDGTLTGSEQLEQLDLPDAYADRG